MKTYSREVVKLVLKLSKTDRPFKFKVKRVPNKAQMKDRLEKKISLVL